MHQPVLLQELVDALTIQPTHTIVDATLGSGGYSTAILSCLGKDGTLVGLDQDRAALECGRKKLAGAAATIHFVEANFRTIDSVLNRLGIDQIDGIVMDLGLSSNQLEESGRGFSFQKDEPLLMTFKEHPTEADLTAREIVNEWSEANLADVIYGFGEERFSRRIAHAIVAARTIAPIERTTQLVKLIEQAVPRWYTFKKVHSATKTFQAIRIAVNDELGALRETIEKSITRLASGGWIAIVTFHSIEDRIVKTHFRVAQQKGMGSVITKKPMVPTKEEVVNNPRARSAKLRIFEKI